MKYGAAILLVMAPALFGCASSGAKQLQAVSPRQIATSPCDAIHRVDPVPVEPDHRTKLALRSTDPVMQVGEARSYFAVVTIDLPDSGSRIVEIESDCDCLGFHKWIFMPLIWVFDKDGRQVSTSDLSTWTRDADLSGGYRVFRTWTFTPPATATYRIMIAADTRDVGTRMAPVKDGPTTVASVGYAATGHFSILVSPRR